MSNRKVLEKLAKGKCIHFWKIDDKGVGVCKKCREEQSFPTPKNVDEIIPERQKSKGMQEVDYYRRQVVGTIVEGVHY